MPTPVLFSTFFDKKKTINKLIDESRPGGEFYFLLAVSAFITTLGLIENSPVVIIGGMLVAPLLSPILSVGMGITTASREGLMWSFRIILRSLLLVVAVSFATSFLFFRSRELTPEILSRIKPNLNLFMIAFAAGAAAAFAWVRSNLSAVIPGIAVSVSLLPPLSVTGIGIETFSRSVISGSLTLFFINFLGIVVASVIIFSLFGFATLQSEAEKKIADEKKRDDANKKREIDFTEQ